MTVGFDLIIGKQTAAAAVSASAMGFAAGAVPARPATGLAAAAVPARALGFAAVARVGPDNQN